MSAIQTAIENELKKGGIGVVVVPKSCAIGTKLFVKGNRLTKEDMLDGSTNYLGDISENNGVRQLIDAPAIHNANSITLVE
jgi:hypothetical protein